MVGTVMYAVANALAKWDKLKEHNLYPVRTTGGTVVLEDAPLPCIAVHLVGKEGKGNTYFGGGIRQYFDLELYVITQAYNVSFTTDAGMSALDMSNDVIRCMELTTELDEVKQKLDLNLQYNRMDTETTYATVSAMSVMCDVHKIVYDADVHFDPLDEEINRYVQLKRVEIYNGVNESVIQAEV